MNSKAYIDSGILEAYVLGSVSDVEAEELLRFKSQYPEIQLALQELESDMEFIARQMAISPPPGTWIKISDNIDDLIITQPQLLRPIPGTENNEPGSKQQRYIEVESESTHMRVHKTWKWIFVAVFILSKIFLIAAIYYYLENRQAQQQIQELKTELKRSAIH